MDLFLKELLLFYSTRFIYIIVAKKELDNSDFIGAILMDLFKAYDCLPHDLITAKLEAYGLSKNSLKLLLDYLEGPKPRGKISFIQLLV